MSYMFYQCTSLKYLDISKFKIKNKAITRNMFDECYALVNKDIYERKFYKKDKCICF